MPFRKGFAPYLPFHHRILAPAHFVRAHPSLKRSSPAEPVHITTVPVSSGAENVPAGCIGAAAVAIALNANRGHAGEVELPAFGSGRRRRWSFWIFPEPVFGRSSVMSK